MTDPRFDPAQAEYFLDKVAARFDAGMSVSANTLFVDPIDKQPITAQAFLDRIRLGT